VSDDCTGPIELAWPLSAIELACELSPIELKFPASPADLCDPLPPGLPSGPIFDDENNSIWLSIF